MTKFQPDLMQKMKLDQRNFSISGESNTGLCRNSNEDTFLLHRSEDGNAVLAVVADGIGGHALGDVASHVCCRELFLQCQHVPGYLWNGTLLRNGLLRANKLLFERNFREERMRPIGTSVVAAIFATEGIFIANVGDSRFYEYNPEMHPALIQHSVDHKPDPEMISLLKKQGLLPVGFSYVSTILRSIGSRIEVEIDEKFIEWKKDSRYLLCSDGCYSMIPQIKIENVLHQEESPQAMTGALMREVLLAGAKDNVSVITALHPGSK